MKTHDALAVANWFLARAEADGKNLTPMQLQKLIYFAHGWALALTGVPLIRQRPQAWDWGPVIPSVYHQFKDYGRKPIRERAIDFDWSGLTEAQEFTDLKIFEPAIDDDPEAEALLKRIWEVYGDLTGFQLSNMSHLPGGAWDKANQIAKGRRGVDIADDLIKAEFAEKTKHGARNPALDDQTTHRSSKDKFRFSASILWVFLSDIMLNHRKPSRLVLLRKAKVSLPALFPSTLPEISLRPHPSDPQSGRRKGRRRERQPQPSRE